MSLYTEGVDFGNILKSEIEIGIYERDSLLSNVAYFYLDLTPS